MNKTGLQYTSVHTYHVSFRRWKKKGLQKKGDKEVPTETHSRAATELQDAALTRSRCKEGEW